MKKKLSLSIFILSVIMLASVSSAEIQKFSSSDFTEIPNLLHAKILRKMSDEEKSNAKAQNELLEKFDLEMETASRATFRGEKPKHKFYTYTVKKDDLKGGKGFPQIASHLNQKHSTVATLNCLENPDDISAGDKLIISVRQGIFLRETPVNSLEILLSQTYSKEINEDTEKISIDGKTFYYLPKINIVDMNGKSRPDSANFYGTILYFFHDKGMVLPLSKKVITSPFGYRTSPISGEWKMHNGIDLAAPEGSEVFATKAGTVTEAGFSTVYGNYITIRHSGEKSSLYAHLSKINVKKDEKVSTGQTIGLVGTTGMSTGPHLHFEIHEGETPKDPSSFLKK